MSALLQTALYSVAAVRALDAAAIAGGTPGLALMQRAGLAAWQVLQRRWPTARRIAVLCGPGNNGGDGYVLALAAKAAGYAVDLLEVGDGRRGADAAACRQAALAAGLVPHAQLDHLTSAEVLVDALFGIGLTRAPANPYAEAIAAINAAGRPVLSLDLPSGLNADTGTAPGVAVRASVTVTFIALKQGLVTGQASDFVGALELAALDLPPDLGKAIAPSAQRLAAPRLTARRRTAHKGEAGHVLVIGGSAGYAGAARLAAEAALRCGAGLVSVATMAASVPLVQAGRPEIMTHAIADASQLLPLLARASVIAIGPGLGQGPWAQALFGAVRDLPLPLVVDADALNLLAINPQQREHWCLTPHPGEAARLIGVADARAINADRYAAAGELRARYGGTVILKGAGSLVAGPAGIGVVTAGNPGMASGGMGDVLTGVVAALCAQGMDLPTAAASGAMAHAMAADRAAARDGERGLLASDLLPELRRLLN